MYTPYLRSFNIFKHFYLRDRKNNYFLQISMTIEQGKSNCKKYGKKKSDKRRNQFTYQTLSSRIKIIM